MQRQAALGIHGCWLQAQPAPGCLPAACLEPLLHFLRPRLCWGPTYAGCAAGISDTSRRCAAAGPVAARPRCMRCCVACNRHARRHLNLGALQRRALMMS